MRAEESYVPIDCGDYDYLEIACSNGYEISLTLVGDVLTGRAQTLQTRATGEFLVVHDEHSATTEVRLDRIVKLTVISRPTHFLEHEFTRSPSCKA